MSEPGGREPTVREPIVRELAAGSSAPVLVADFDAFSDAPNLSVFLAGQVSDRPVYQVDPVAMLEQDGFLPLTELAAAAASEFEPAITGHPRAFVVGYCSASALAMRIADRLPVPASVILVRPTWPDDQLIAVTFAEICARLGGQDRACPDLAGNPAAVLARLDQVLGEELAALATRMGLESTAEAFTDLLTRYHAWLGFLLASRASAQPGQPATAVIQPEAGRDTPAELASLVLASITELTANTSGAGPR